MWKTVSIAGLLLLWSPSAGPGDDPLSDAHPLEDYVALTAGRNVTGRRTPAKILRERIAAALRFP